MTSLSRLSSVARQRFRAAFHAKAADEELRRELALHMDLLVEEFEADGLSREDAQRAARRAIGNVPLLEEQCRDHRRMSWFHDLRQDLSYGARMLGRNPGFTGVAVVSLAVGIGANTAILSTMDAMLRADLAIPDDERLVVVRTYPLDNPAQETHALLDDFVAWRDANRSFEIMGMALGNQADFGADGEAVPAERIQGQAVTGGTLAALGVKPIAGRVFTASESDRGPPEPVVIISHRLWERRFGSRADIIGRTARLDRVNRTIIGVLPEGFHYPNAGVDYWIPLEVYEPSRLPNRQRFFVVTARLNEWTTIEQAQSDMDIVAARLAKEDPERRDGWGIRVKPIREAMFGWARGRLLTLEAAVVLVLLVACTNLAGLLFARGLVRMPEIAMRTALGAGRGRIIRQLLAESLLLSLIGGALGVVVAMGGVRVLAAMNPPPGGVAIVGAGISVRTLEMTGLISIATGLLFGLAPALVTARAGLNSTFKASPPAVTASLPPRFRNALVAAQIAITVVLLVGSGLLMKSFVQVASRDLQFDPERLLTFEIHVPLTDYLHRVASGGTTHFEVDPPPAIAFERIYRGLSVIPGVESVAGSSFPLVNSVVLPSTTIDVESTSAGGTHAASEPAPSLAIGVGSDATHLSDRRSVSAAYFLVTPGFFTAIKARFVRGRDFDIGDVSSSPWVAIVNESAAHRFWSGQDPVGRQFTMPDVLDERPRQVVGVVRDIPLTPQGEQRPVIYTSYLQQPLRVLAPVTMFGQMMFMVRATGDPMNLVATAHRVVNGVDPDRPLSNVMTLEQRLTLSVVPQHGYVVFIITAFALTATLLAAIGIYGVLAYSVSQREREIGIRFALGAGVIEVVMLVSSRALMILSIGISIGLAVSLVLTRFLQSQLFNVAPTDPATFAGVAVLLIAVSLAAALVPIRRAAGMDPTVALRCE
jgi:ABC-type lipoprotein release transport system permease subunit